MANKQKLGFLKRVYLSIGIHGAPKGTILYSLNRFLYQRLGGRNSDLLRLKEINAKTSLADSHAHQVTSPNKLCIAIRITGGIGDHLVAARYMRDLQNATEGFSFDVHTLRPATARWIFANVPGFRESFDEQLTWNSIDAFYPFGLWVTQFVEICGSKNVDWLSLQKSHPKLVERCATIKRFYPKIEYAAIQHPYLDGHLAHQISFMNMNRYNFLQGMSGITYGGPQFNLSTDQTALATHGLTKDSYVTLHNGFDTEFCVDAATLGTRSMKTYPHFGNLIRLLKKEYPTLKVVQLGSTSSTPIEGVDFNLINRTSLQQGAEIIKNAVLHIDNESGLVHLAACLGTKSCVVFGPTSVEHFGYDDNINIRPTFCGNCWWTTPTWMKNCPRGFGEARCLSEQPAENVFKAIVPYLSSAPKLRASEKISIRVAN